MKRKGEKYYTDVMIGSLYGLTSKIIRELFPSPMKIVFDRRGWGHPAWPESVVREIVEEPRVKSYIAERMQGRRMPEIISYLREFDYDEMISYAQTMDREFVLHIGPTNSGKTYQALQELRKIVPSAYLSGRTGNK